MGIINDLEETAKEFNLSFEKVSSDWNKINRKIYKERIGEFTGIINYFALSELKSKYQKDVKCQKK